MKYKGIQVKQDIKRIKARIKSKVPTKPTKERYRLIRIL